MKSILAIFIVIASLFCIPKPSFCQAENEKVPVIFVHGMLGSGDTWTNPVRYFIQSGYPENYLHAFDWNSLNMNRGKAVEQLSDFVNDILQKTGSKHLNLVGHSAGGGICLQYINSNDNAKHVSKYVHLGSGKLTGIPQVETLNLYSPEDKITGGSDYEGVSNVSIPSKDHYEIATSYESFVAMYRFFNKQEPDSRNSESPSAVSVSGKACTLGENQPEINAQIDIFQYCKQTGKRLSKAPVYSTFTDNHGRWGPFLADSTAFYEMVVTSKESDKKPVHYFREPFTSSNPLVYLRTLAASGFASVLLKNLPSDNKQAALAIFCANRAVIHGRDELFVNNIELSSALLAPASKTAIAFFMYDANANKKSDGQGIPNFLSMPFMSGADVFFPVKKNALISIGYNKRTINLQPIKSRSGIMVAVFE